MDSRNVAIFVLMRFNVRFSGFEHLDNTDPDWLDYRLALARLTAFHSLRLQSLNGFRLVMLIDSATPERCVDALKDATQGLDVILHEAESANPTSLSSALLDHVDPGCLAIQTSRIDSDDMFHPDYLRSIAEYCERNGLYQDLAHSPRYFRFPQGQDYLAQTATYNRICYPENAFGTLIEPVSAGIRTVFCENHKRMSKKFVSFSIDDDRPMWCRVIHGSNLLNKPRKPLALTGHFPVHPDLAKFAEVPTVHPPQKHAPRTSPSLEE